MGMQLMPVVDWIEGGAANTCCDSGQGSPSVERKHRKDTAFRVSTAASSLRQRLRQKTSGIRAECERGGRTRATSGRARVRVWVDGCGDGPVHAGLTETMWSTPAPASEMTPPV